MLFRAFLAHFITFGLLCPILFFWASSARFIIFGLLCPILFFWASSTRFIAFMLLYPIRAPLSHLFSLGYPGPVCFPWASSALFLTSHYHEFLLTSLGFPGPITLFSSFGLMGLPSNPYFLCFHYFVPIVAHSHIIYCPWFAFSLFSGSFRPIYLFKTHLFISWACDPLFLPFGFNGFLLNLLTLFFPYCWASSCYWAPLPKWALTLPLFKGIVDDDDVCILPLLISWFASWRFLVILDFYSGTHLFMSVANCILISSRFCSSTYSFLRFWGTNTHFSASAEYVDTFCCNTCGRRIRLDRFN